MAVYEVQLEVVESRRVHIEVPDGSPCDEMDAAAEAAAALMSDPDYMREWTSSDIDYDQDVVDKVNEAPQWRWVDGQLRRPPMLRKLRERIRRWWRDMHDDSQHDPRPEDSACPECHRLRQENLALEQRLGEAQGTRLAPVVDEYHLDDLTLVPRVSPEPADKPHVSLGGLPQPPPGIDLMPSMEFLRSRPPLRDIGTREPGKREKAPTWRPKRDASCVIRACEDVTGPSYDRRWAPTNDVYRLDRGPTPNIDLVAVATHDLAAAASRGMPEG